MTPSLQTQVKGHEAAKFAHCLRIIFVIEMHTYIFGWDRKNFLLGVFPMGREVSRERTCLGKLYTAGICDNSFKKFFLYALLFLFRLNFTQEVVKSICPGYVFTEIELSREYFHGEGGFSVDVGSDFLALFKKG